MDEKGSIAVVNAVLDGRFLCTIRTKARGTGIAGSLCCVHMQDQSVLCRVGIVDMMNPIHASPAFQPLIMEQGYLPHFSRDTDIETTNLDVIACIDARTQQIVARRSNPSSGTEVLPVTSDEIGAFLAEKTHYLNIGYLPNDPEIPMSVVNKHFGAVGEDRAGWGEARHTLVAGQNGSGKTVLATAMIAGKLVAHPAMGCFIPDTAGDISNDASFSKGDEFRYSFHDLLRRGGREPTVIGINDVRLEDDGAFSQVIAPLLHKWFSIDGEKADRLARLILDVLEARQIELRVVGLESFLRIAREEVSNVYAGKHDRNGQRRSETGDAKRDDIDRLLAAPERLKGKQREWDRDVAALFQKGRHSIRELLDMFLDGGKVVILRLSQMPENHQRFVMYEIFRTLGARVARRFKISNHTVNSLIVLDEAPRWVPQNGDDPIRSEIIDAICTTRKYGLGWFFISQRLASIHKEVLSQAHTSWYGRNLGVGADAEHLEKALGKSGTQAYRALDLQGGFFWMGVGQDVNLGVGNTYMSLITHGGDATEAIIRANPHIWRR